MSANVSPFALEVEFGSENPRILPPSLIIAASKLNCPSQICENSFGFEIIFSANTNISLSSSFEKSIGLIKCLFLIYCHSFLTSQC